MPNDDVISLGSFGMGNLLIPSGLMFDQKWIIGMLAMAFFIVRHGSQPFVIGLPVN